MSDESIDDEIVQINSARFNRREKYLAYAGAILCFVLFWVAGRIFRVPTNAHFSAAIFEQYSPGVTVLIIAVVFAVSVAIGVLITGVVGFDAGIFCACCGLCAISARGGPIRFTLFDDPTHGIWLKLILETILLGIFVWAGTAIQQLLHRAGVLHYDEHRHVVAEIHESAPQRIAALLLSVVVMAILLMFLAASDRKIQVLCGVAVSSFLSTLLAYYIIPTRPSIWYWAAPFVVGAIGYGFQYVGGAGGWGAGGWAIGEVRGTFAGLARPLPLDYAGAGVAASILAYWISRRWQHEREVSSIAEDQA